MAQRTANEGPEESPRVRNEQLLLLTGTAGCFDAISFLGDGHVFSANMTGSTVLLGIALGQGHIGASLNSALALVGYCLGVFVGALFLGRAPARPIWTSRVTAAVALESAALLLYALLWLFIGPRIELALILLSTLAMGQQSATALYLGITGITTTYLTGTLTRLMRGAARLLRLEARAGPGVLESEGARKTEHNLARMISLWLVYFLAAVLGGAVFAHIPSVAVFIPLAAILLVVLDALLLQRRRPRE